MIAVIQNSVGAYAFNYIIYVVLAVFMAGFAGLYVITLAPYAAGSGIPEVVLSSYYSPPNLFLILLFLGEDHS